jgi:hypothetical protein
VSVPPSSSSLTTRWPPGATTPASTSENAAAGVVSYYHNSRHMLAQLLTASRAYARCALHACSPASHPASLAYVPLPPQPCSRRCRLLAIMSLRPVLASHSALSLQSWPPRGPTASPRCLRHTLAGRSEPPPHPSVDHAHSSLLMAMSNLLMRWPVVR